MKRSICFVLLALLVAAPLWSPAAAYVSGDADGSGFVDIDDIVFLIGHVFSGFTAPEPYLAGDPNCSWFVDIDDIVYLINYVFDSGPAPCVHPNPAGENVGHSDCKPYVPAGSKVDHPSNEDCIDYSYSNGVLNLRHVNGAFNCCPKTIGGDVYLGSDWVWIEEFETFDFDPCPCLCVYDVDYQVINLPPGQYTIRIDGLYLYQAPYLLTTIDLIAEPQGSFCIEREDYPWVQ